MSTRQKITAIIKDKRGRVLSIGKNSYSKTHPLMASLSEQMGEPYKIYLHAEVAAIVRCKDLSKAYSMEIYRVDKRGNYRLAKPCPICQAAIREAGIKHVWFSTNTKKVHNIKQTSKNKSSLIFS